MKHEISAENFNWGVLSDFSKNIVKFQANRRLTRENAENYVRFVVCALRPHKHDHPGVGRTSLTCGNSESVRPLCAPEMSCAAYSAQTPHKAAQNAFSQVRERTQSAQLIMKTRSTCPRVHTTGADLKGGPLCTMYASTVKSKRSVKV